MHTPKIFAPNSYFASSEIIEGGRRFYITAEQVNQQLVRDITIHAWGFNGTTPGPVLVVYEGERIQIVLYNKLPESTSIHWHGLIVRNNVDGVPEIGSGVSVGPGEYYVYDFIIQQTGTFMYHAHANDAKQEMMGLAGMLISLPHHESMVDREYVLLLQEWSVQTGTTMQDMMSKNNREQASEKIYSIDPMSMDFNYFTINGKAFPDTQTMHVRYEERIRFRIGNLSMNSHPMHLHGHVFNVTATDGSPLPVPYHKTTINVAPGETYDIEFLANNPGIWAFHCHKPHHITNEHKTKMGGMFTTVRYV
ncbi:multicopper oxidase family protein [Aneurinibacillus terranovensis]|uniref:multicopper oxidase family protein n=1 Tax=Aneurinibacillus terranovensis TaxID=278991 RepID=UPI0003F68A7D|nr:multicopper oxidase domain-containing protein [Aneurinibacillus terranovensis]